MKKIYFLLFFAFVGLFGFGQVFITEMADPNNNDNARFIELYNAGGSAVDFSTGWQMQRATNGNNYWATAVNLTGTIPAGGFYIICNHQTTFTSIYSFAADQVAGSGGFADSNGDDQIRLLSPGSVVEDIFGVMGEDGSGTNHEFEDGRAERKATVTTGNTTYTFAEWNVWNDTGADGTTNDPQDAPADFDPGSWIGEGPAGPSITVNETSLSGFNYTVLEGPSAEQSFTVEGSNLTADISVTAPTNYEISTGTGGSFVATSPITLTQSGGLVATTTIYVRLKAGLSVGDYDSENISAASTDATSKTVTCAGSVSPGPVTNFPWTEDFESGSFLPTGWTSYEAGDPAGWSETTSYSYSTSHAAFHNDDNVSSGCDDWLITRALDLTGVNSPSLYYWERVNYSGSALAHNVKYSTNYVGSGDPELADWENLNIVIGVDGTWVEKGPFALPNAAEVYIAFQYKGDYDSEWWIDDVFVSGLLPEPTNHATNLILGQGTPNTSVIEMVWDDATVGTLPNGYLVKGSNTSLDVISTPSDGTPEDDGSLILNVAYGDEYAEFTGLSENTTYYFKIFPYTNSGSNIDYKTNGTIPSASMGTFGAPVSVAANGLNSSSFTANWEAVSGADSYRLDVSEYVDFEIVGGNASDLFISQVAEDGNHTYVEIANFTGSSVSLNNYDLVAYHNGATSAGTTIDLTDAGIIADQDVWVIAYSSASQWSGTPDQTSGSLNQNGNDVYALRKNSSNIDVFGSIGSSSYFYNDKNVLRNSDANAPTTSYSSDEWSFSSYSSGDPAGLGAHTFSGGSTPSFVIGYGNLDVNGLSQSVTGLTESTTYYYRVRAYDGSATSDNSNTITVTTTAATAGLWAGATSESWTDDSNWDSGSVPIASVDVVIPAGLANYPTILNGDAAECKNLTIKSDASGDASLIGQEYLTVNGTTTVERYVSGFAGGEPGWHFLSSPVQDLAVATSGFVPGSGVDDFYQWDEATNTWLNYYDSGVDPTFDEGKGYLVAYSAEGTKTFTGALNTATESESLSYTENGEAYGDGWNLLGNPYPSAIDWDLLGKTGSVLGSVYVIKASDGSYINWNGTAGALTDGIIPPHQGFFVQAGAASQTVTISNAAQVHPNHSFYKSTDEFNETIEVSLKGQDSENSTYFQFRDDASQEFDGHADAYKLFGWATIAQVYSEIDGTQYAINCLPHSEETITVPLGIQLTADEELTLDFSGMDSFFNTVRIDLEDLETGIMTNVRENPTYTFQATTEDNANRFLLHFNGVTAVEELNDEIAPQVYAVEDLIYINHAQDLDADIFIYATNGHLVGQDKMSKESMKRISVNGSTGIYLVTIQTNDAIYTEKVYIK